MSVSRSDSYGELDLMQLGSLLWCGRRLIIIAAVGLAGVFGVGSLLVSDKYQAEALYAPNLSDSQFGSSGALSQYQGLASLAGVDLGGSGASDRIALGLQVLQSRKFITEFAREREILVPLFATKRWDPKSRELEIDSSSFDTATQTWVRKEKFPRTSVPSDQEVYEKFSDILAIGHDQNTGIIRITITHRSPVAAAQWLSMLVEDLNRKEMEKDVSASEHAIAYLEGQIATTSLSGMQDVLFRLVEEQMNTIMLSQISDEYLLKTIDPPVEPELPASPNRVFIAAVGGMLGLLAAIGYLLVRREVDGSR